MSADTIERPGAEGGGRMAELAAKEPLAVRAHEFFRAFDAARWMWLGAWCFFAITFAIIAANIALQISDLRVGADGVRSPLGSDGWTALDKFTYQSNILLLVYSTFYVWFPKHQFLRRGKFLIATTVYIFFTFVGFNAILTGMGGGYISTLSATAKPYDFPFTLFEHLFAPLLFIGCALAQMWLKPFSTSSYLYTTLPGMIYPTIYVIYAASIPWVMHEPNAFYNVDASGALTTAGDKAAVYSVYDTATDTVNHPALAWPIIILVWLAFFPGSFAVFYYSNKALRARAQRQEQRQPGAGYAL